MVWSGYEFACSMPNTRTQTNMHLGLTTRIYYPPDCTHTQSNWQLEVLVRIYVTTIDPIGACADLDETTPPIMLKWLPWMTGCAFIRHLCGTANSIHKPRLPNIGQDLLQTLVQCRSGLLRGVGFSWDIYRYTKGSVLAIISAHDIKSIMECHVWTYQWNLKNQWW